jgi:ribonuclease H2 subunit C
MLSIQPTKPQKCTPNLLPARINHNGPINDAERYWKPETDSKGICTLFLLYPQKLLLTHHKGKQHAYFRGRHLQGTTLPLPENYTGAVLHVTDKQLPHFQSPSRSPSQPADEDGDEEVGEESIPVEVKIAEQVGTFEQVVVWGHGGEVHGAHDMFVRGMTEWVGFAESIHVDEEEEVVGKAKV